MHDASLSFKKETVVGISELYRQFVAETNRKFDRVAVLHHFVKYVLKTVCGNSVLFSNSSLKTDPFTRNGA